MEYRGLGGGGVIGVIGVSDAELTICFGRSMPDTGTALTHLACYGPSLPSILRQRWLVDDA